MIDRLPPQNVEAEQGVLGSLLLDDARIADVVLIVGVEDFYRDAHQVLYRAIRDLADLARPVDAVTVAEELGRRGQIKAVGGEDYLAELVMGVPHAANATYYAHIVRQKSIARRLAETAGQILTDVYSNNFTAEDLMERAERAVLAVGDSDYTTGGSTLREAVDASLHAFAGRRAGQGQGLPTGLVDLDDTLFGLRPGKLYVLAARPSIGKSCLALNIADHVAYDEQRPVLFVSLEMTKEELADRFLCARAKVDGTSYQRAVELDGAARDRLLGVAESVAYRSRLAIADPATLTLPALGALARRHKARHGLDLLVIDYLQLIDGQPTRGEIREQVVARVSRRLKAIAKELAIPVLTLCQLNRSVEGREDRKPRLGDLRESGQIEQDADVVLLLHRPDQYDPNDQPGMAKLIIAKNRGGQTGTIELSFQRQYQRFANYYPESDSVPAAASPF